MALSSSRICKNSPGSSVSSPAVSIFSSSEIEVSTVASTSPSFAVSSPSSSASTVRHESGLSSGLRDGQAAQKYSCRQRRLCKANLVRLCDDRGQPVLKTCTCQSRFKDKKMVVAGSCFFKGRSIVVTLQKGFFRFAGAFAADCTALCCCPCSIISLLAWVLVKVPSAVATRLIASVKKIPSLKDSAISQRSNGDDADSISAFSMSNTEPHHGGDVLAVHIVRFDTETLVKHFDAEYMGFGNLSLKRE